MCKIRSYNTIDIDGSQSTVLAVDDFTRRLWTRGGGTDGGGWADATREEAAEAGGGAMRKRKWCASYNMVLLLVKSGKSLGSR